LQLRIAFARIRPLHVVILLAGLSLAPAAAQTGDLVAEDASGVDAGAYLAAREAGLSRDFPVSIPFLDRLLDVQPDDLGVREQLILAHLALGQFDQAAALSPPLLAADPGNAGAALALVVDGFARQDHAAVLTVQDAGGQGNPLLDGLATAWAQLGQGRVTEALATLDDVSERQGAEVFVQFCRSLMLALVGDAEGALAIIEDPAGITRDALNRRGTIAYVQLLGLVDRFDDALAVIDARFGGATDPELQRMRTAYADGQSLPFDLITNPEQGMAEVYALMAGAILSPQSQRDALLYAQAALAINPLLSDARIITGQIFEAFGLLDLAAETYGMIAQDDGFALVAAMGLAQTLESQGEMDRAIEVLGSAVARHPDNQIAPQLLGDFLRRAGRHDEAIAAYTAAIDGMRAQGRDPGWQLWFARAVSHERSGQWELAEADFRAALDIEPDQPTVLNYLGYSLVERREKLDEALEMIERAVAGEPDSGYIVDSLAWALFRLGRYDEALPHMERAVELMPADPILNDHLGDVYWSVGRKREAQFQWRRALSFGPHDDLDMDRVRRKLEVGLDQVLVEEGADPLHPGR
jgi:tetratricopeptide (TPR) repeat protein